MGEALVHPPGRLAECYTEHAGMSGEALVGSLARGAHPGSARG